MIALLVILSIITTFKDALLSKNNVGFLGKALISYWIESVISFLVTYFLKPCQKKNSITNQLRGTSGLLILQRALRITLKCYRQVSEALQSTCGSTINFIKYCNFASFPSVEILWKRTVYAEFETLRELLETLWKMRVCTKIRV